jgi:molybdopterin converting factor small subunit
LKGQIQKARSLTAKDAKDAKEGSGVINDAIDFIFKMRDSNNEHWLAAFSYRLLFGFLRVLRVLGGSRFFSLMKVLIPGALRSYTEKSEVEADGATLAVVLVELERQYPGIRFRMIDEQDRIRRHIRIFVNGEQVRELSQPLATKDEVVIVQALSGG